jgi:hypothetical protein
MARCQRWPSPPAATQVVDTELESLYRRRDALDRLIASLEDYQAIQAAEACKPNLVRH